MPKKIRDHTRARPDLTQDRPSRTQKKKAAEALQKTGEQLLLLTGAQLDQLSVAPELKQAVIDARTMTQHGARRRQLQYIGTLMRDTDGEWIRQKLAEMAQQSSSETRRFKQVELWRDELKAGSDQRLAWLIDQFPDMDRAELDGLIQNTRQINPQAARKAGKALFRFLRDLVDENGH